MAPFLHPRDTILFQGDSITDVGRRESPDGLGTGYVSHLAGRIQACHPDAGWKVLNRGIGGDRTVELLARWKADCLDLRPNVLSVKIGVNDVWRFRATWEGQTFVTAAEFEANYRRLLDLARDAGITRLVLVSPTVIDDNRDRQLADFLDDRTAAVKALAREYGAVYVPAREAFVKALETMPEVQWTVDGCHPTAAGHALLAAVWAEAVGI
jgi:lysophospholipase L1-like esterase